MASFIAHSRSGLGIPRPRDSRILPTSVKTSPTARPDSARPHTHSVRWSIGPTYARSRFTVRSAHTTCLTRQKRHHPAAAAPPREGGTTAKSTV
eukprot:877826-Prymnesium_polylepis.1